MAKADRHCHSPERMNLGLDGEMRVRLEEPVRQQARALYDRIYHGVPAPPFNKFIGFCFALGVDLLGARYPQAAQNKRRR